MPDPTLPLPENPPLAEDAAAEPRPPLSPVEFSTRRDHSLVTEALQHRLESLEKLSKKIDDEGYPSMARKVAVDAIQIREIVLPKFRAQAELPFASPADLRSAVSGLIAPAFVSHPVTENTDVESRDRDIIDAIVGKISRAIVLAAERGFWMGEAARENDATAIGLRAISDAQKPVPKP